MSPLKFLFFTSVAVLSTVEASFLVPKRNFHGAIVLLGKRGGGKVEKERINKSDLPEKMCCVCGRPFAWRKKWERSWDEITTCSKACNSKRRSEGRVTGKPDQPT